MELRLWKYGIDDCYIMSFLDGMSKAHGEDRKSIEWFHWKFEQSPYGRAILACAFDGSIVAGCVAYGMGKIAYHNQVYTAALSYETFVHPSYQRRGLFKKLIYLAEAEAKHQGIPFLYNFPNANSIQGFRHMGWICRNDIQQYSLKIVNPIHVLCHFLDLRKSFNPYPSNIESICDVHLDDIVVEKSNPDVICPIWTKEYLKWRFFTFPNRQYYVFDDKYVFAIAMVGRRGRITNAHILYILSKKLDVPNLSCADRFLKGLYRDIKPDIITYKDSIENRTPLWRRGFMKISGQSNFCYRVIDDDFVIKSFRMMLPSINAHTY